MFIQIATKAFLLSCLFLVSCGSEINLDLSSDQCQMTQPLYVEATKLWPEDDISVCIINPEAITIEQLELIRLSVSQTWERYSSIRFTGWIACLKEINDYDVVLSFKRFPFSGTFGLGKAINNEQSVVILNVFHNELPEKLCKTEEECARIIAVHEFGHVLGFAHEHNRVDTPLWCQHEPQGNNGTVMTGSWDPYSVMNYCNYNWLGSGKLSCGDIDGLQAVYGPPRKE